MNWDKRNRTKRTYINELPHTPKGKKEEEIERSEGRKKKWNDTDTTLKIHWANKKQQSNGKCFERVCFVNWMKLCAREEECNTINTMFLSEVCI